MISWVPHNYQLTAISLLITNKRLALFLDPGLGKTSTSLAAIKILINSGAITSVLMVAPLRVTYSVWPSEIEKWVNFNDLTCTILHDDNKQSLWGDRKDIYLINPEGLEWLHSELLNGLSAGKKCPFNTLWIDESTKFKAHDSNRFKYITDMLPLFKRRYIMTGTPSPKSLLDLWSQIYILDEGKALGKSYHKFRSTHFETDSWNKHNWKIKEFSADTIHEKVAPLVLDMSSEDYLSIKPIIYNYIDVTLSPKVLKKYKQMEGEFFTTIDSDELSADASAQAGMKCHQIANGKIYENVPEDLTEDEIKKFKKTRKTLHVHSLKIEALKDLVDELNGKPLLISYYYKHDLVALQKAFGKNLPYIGSGVSASKSKLIENKWNRGEIPILAGHPDSMGHGLNLQEFGNDICWFSLTWNLENYIQFNKRIHRQGVSGSVRVHHLVAKDTVDEAMVLRLGERAENQIDLRHALREYRKTR